MSDYDSTNTGVIFQPHHDQSLAGQGKLNIEGAETRIVMIKEKLSRDGDPVLVVYQRVGPLFANESDNEKAPKYSGPMDTHPDLRMAAWPGEKDGRRYMSLKVSERQSNKGDDYAKDPLGTNGGGGHADMDDEIPF